MSTQPEPLGTCPECGAEIRESQILVEYEKDGKPHRYADCYTCGDVVDPE